MVKTKRYMTQFSCIGPDCPDHCCGGWQITMSSAQAQKLYEVLPESQHQHITLFKDDMMCIDNSGKGSCLFLTEQRWCSVHRDYGEKKLPNICQNFPRKYSPIDHYTEMSGQLSCPEVTRLLLQDSDAFAAAEVGFHGEIQIKEHPQSLFWMIFPKLREIFQRVIQQSDQRMPATLIHVLQFAREIDPFCRVNCHQRDVGHIAAESKRYVTKKVSPLPMEHIDLSTCYQFTREALRVLVEHTPKTQHFQSLLKRILHSYQPNLPAGEIEIPVLLREYLRRKSFYSSHFSELITECWSNLALYYIYDYPNDGSWGKMIVRLIWLEAIWSILWLGHPRLADIEADISEEVLRETLIEVVYSFHRLQHFSDTWEKLLETIDTDPWLQQNPQQVCHLIVG